MKLSILTLILGLLTGCSFGIRDFTSDPRAENFVGKCFELTSESFVYEARCVDLESSGMGSRVMCPGLQSFLAGGKWISFPTSYREYSNKKGYWDETMFDKLLFEEQREIAYPVPAGTKLYISKVVQYPWGSSGHKWVVRAILHPEGRPHQEVELPTIGLLTYGDTWTASEFMSFPELKRDYVQNCQM